MAVNKVVYDGNTLVDLTSDTVTSDKIVSGYTAHDAAGNKITGSLKYVPYVENGAACFPSTIASVTTDGTLKISSIE